MINVALHIDYTAYVGLERTIQRCSLVKDFASTSRYARLFARSAAPIFIARPPRLHRRREPYFSVQSAPRFDPVGNELAGRLTDRRDHARALAPIARRLHGRIDNRLRRRKARVGVVLLRRILEE